MRVRDLTANLLFELADEFGFMIHKFECNQFSSGGNITFSKNIKTEDSKPYVYKLVYYDSNVIHLRVHEINPYYEIDLNDPNSIDLIKLWFKDGSSNFKSLNSLFTGLGDISNVYNHKFPTIGYNPAPVTNTTTSNSTTTNIIMNNSTTTNMYC